MLLAEDPRVLMVRSNKAGWDLHALGNLRHLLMNNRNECPTKKKKSPQMFQEAKNETGVCPAAFPN